MSFFCFRTSFPVLEHSFPVSVRHFPVLDRPFPVLERLFPVLGGDFVPGNPGTEEFVPEHLLLPCPGTKGHRDKIFFVPGQRDNGTSRPMETLRQTRNDRSITQRVLKLHFRFLLKSAGPRYPSSGFKKLLKSSCLRIEKFFFTRSFLITLSVIQISE